MRIFNAVVLGAALLTGTGAVALAQSLSSLPPDTNTSVQENRTLPYGSTQSFYPKPGGSTYIPPEASQPVASAPQSNRNWTGPKPN